jgi:hypothetical protein
MHGPCPPSRSCLVVSHRWSLSRAPEAYRMFNDKVDDGTKVVLDPGA